MMRTLPRDYTVGWICALQVEYLVACNLLKPEYSREQEPLFDRTRDTNAYKFGLIHGHNVVVACLPKGNYSTDTASRVTARLMMSFPKIRFGLMVGIGGGAPTHRVRLGDVVVSSVTPEHGAVLQYDFGKAIQEQEFRLARYLRPPPEILQSALVQIELEHRRNLHHIKQTLLDTLSERPGLLEVYDRPPRDDLYVASYVHLEDGTCDCQKPVHLRDPKHLETRKERRTNGNDPVIHYGLIASANTLMKDAHKRDTLANKYGVLCFEREAAGLMDGFPCLVIRGICDYADSHNNDDWQGYAAATAAAYAKELLAVIPGPQVEDMSDITQLGSLLSDARVRLIAESPGINRISQLDVDGVSDEDLHEHQATLRQSPPMNTLVHDQLNRLRNDQTLLVAAPNYWSHMTLTAYTVYKKLYGLMSTLRGETNILWFVKCMGSDSPEPSRLVEIWQGFCRDPRRSLPRPYSIAFLYMLHMEVFCTTFCTKRPVMDEKRRARLRRFTTWCKCPSPPEGCNISWNFVSQDWGLPRINGGEPSIHCLICNRYLERELFKFKPPGVELDSAYTPEQNAVMDEAHDAFAKAWAKSGSR